MFKALSINAIEAIKAISCMTTGKFTFFSQSPNEQRSSTGHEIDFNKLFAEYNSADGFNYLNRVIDTVVKKTTVPNLFILPAGVVPHNPLEVLGSSRMGFIMDQLKTRFDFIIFDAPPVMPATDALILTPRTDGAVLVIRYGHTDRKIIQNVLDQFEKAGQSIIGTVLNRVNMKKEGYYNKYYSSDYRK